MRKLAELPVGVLTRLPEEAECLVLAHVAARHDDADGGPNGARGLERLLHLRYVFATENSFRLEFGDHLVVELDTSFDVVGSGLQLVRPRLQRVDVSTIDRHPPSQRIDLGLNVAFIGWVLAHGSIMNSRFMLLHHSLWWTRGDGVGPLGCDQTEARCWVHAHVLECAVVPMSMRCVPHASTYPAGLAAGLEEGNQASRIVGGARHASAPCVGLASRVGDHMPQSGRARGWVERERLAGCLRDVAVARARLRAAQTGPGGFGVYDSRVELVTALEACADAITELGAPLPHKLRAEINLQLDTATDPPQGRKSRRASVHAATSAVLPMTGRDATARSGAC